MRSEAQAARSGMKAAGQSEVRAAQQGDTALEVFARRIRKYALVVETSLQSNMAYAANFASSTVFYGLITFVLISLWRTVYAGGQPVQEYSGTQMMWYCMITELVVMSRSDVFGGLTEAVQSGSIAYVLNKPYDYLLYQFADATGLMTVRAAMNAVVGVAMGLLIIGPLPGFSPIALVPIALALFCGMTLNFCMQACLGLTAFWFEENSAFYWICSKLVLVFGLLMPVEYFPDWLERAVRFLPFPYVTYGPARLVVAFSTERFIETIVVQVSYICAFAALAVTMYRRGVRLLNVNGG